MIFAQLSVTLTAVKKVSVQEEQMAACTLHCVSISVKPEFSVQGVLALCKFHYCKFHYCGFSNLSRYTERPRDTRILVPEKNRAAQNRTS